MYIYFRYAKNITKGYFFSMCNALLFFFSLPIIETLTKNENLNNFTIKNFPFAASYPITFYKFPFYEVFYFTFLLYIFIIIMFYFIIVFNLYKCIYRLHIYLKYWQQVFVV